MSLWYLQFFQKIGTKKIDFTIYGTSSWIVFVCFLRELKTLKRHFETNWPLAIYCLGMTWHFWTFWRDEVAYKVSVWPFVRNPSIPSGATKQGRANTQLSRQLRTTEHHLLFQKRRKNSSQLPLLPPFALMAPKPHFQLFFLSSSFSWLSLWWPRKQQANMPDRSSQRSYLRLLDKRIYKTEMKFWDVLGCRGCREKKTSKLP